MVRIASLVYGVVTYAVMFLTLLYLFGFLANFAVPKGIDDGQAVSFAAALAMNVALIALFGISHSVMARPGFKQQWTRIVPVPIERSTYVLVATLVTALLMWQWRPMSGVIWQAESAWAQGIWWSLYVLGIAVLLVSTFIIDHFDLFGLRQVYLNFRQKTYTHHRFKVSLLYKFVRHPLYVGWLLIFWSTPSMTVGHLVFAVGMSAYILIAIPYEERDLVTYHGEDYQRYRQRVPMLIPRPGRVHETVNTEHAAEQR